MYYSSGDRLEYNQAVELYLDNCKHFGVPQNKQIYHTQAKNFNMIPIKTILVLTDSEVSPGLTEAVTFLTAATEQLSVPSTKQTLLDYFDLMGSIYSLTYNRPKLNFLVGLNYINVLFPYYGSVEIKLDVTNDTLDLNFKNTQSRELFAQYGFSSIKTLSYPKSLKQVTSEINNLNSIFSIKN